MMMILLVAKEQLSAQTYKNWGVIMAIAGIAVIVNAVVRAVFIVRIKYVQIKGVSFEEVDIDQKKLQTERAV